LTKFFFIEVENNFIFFLVFFFFLIYGYIFFYLKFCFMILFNSMFEFYFVQAFLQYILCIKVTFCASFLQWRVSFIFSCKFCKCLHWFFLASIFHPRPKHLFVRHFFSWVFSSLPLLNIVWKIKGSSENENTLI
jgi:hypothetical protein